MVLYENNRFYSLKKSSSKATVKTGTNSKSKKKMKNQTTMEPEKSRPPEEFDPDNVKDEDEDEYDDFLNKIDFSKLFGDQKDNKTPSSSSDNSDQQKSDTKDEEEIPDEDWYDKYFDEASVNRESMDKLMNFNAPKGAWQFFLDDHHDRIVKSLQFTDKEMFDDAKKEDKINQEAVREFKLLSDKEKAPYYEKQVEAEQEYLMKYAQQYSGGQGLGPSEVENMKVEFATSLFYDAKANEYMKKHPNTNQKELEKYLKREISKMSAGEWDIWMKEAEKHRARLQRASERKEEQFSKKYGFKK